MSTLPRIPTITSQDARPREGNDTVFKGAMSWFSLFDSANTPTSGLTVGIAEVPPQGCGKAHWHAEPELYYILQGHGHMEVDDVAYDVHPGHAIYVPGDAKHNIFNKADVVMKILYVFPTDGLGDVEYQFEDGATWRLGTKG